MMAIAYLTDVEGRWDKLEAFCAGNDLVSLVDDQLVLADGATFVFGGDAIDRGPAGRKIIATLLAAHRRYGDRVVLLAGNRDLNKLRLAFELTGSPPPKAEGRTGGELLRWILTKTMGAAKAFEHRAAELATTDDNAVVASFVEDLGPGGSLRAYLNACRLGYRHGSTLFLHGGVTAENAGVVPNMERAKDVDGWLANLGTMIHDELAAFAKGTTPDTVIAYQAPRPGTKLNQMSVVYARPADEHNNPRLPPDDVIAWLRDSGIGRLVVGHTPSGDCPAIVRSGDFEMVFGDNSYGRSELGSQLSFTDAETRVRGFTQLDDGTRLAVDFTTARATDHGTLLGTRDLEGRLYKARLPNDRYLAFRGLPEYRVEQTAVQSK